MIDSIPPKNDLELRDPGHVLSEIHLHLHIIDMGSSDVLVE